MKFLFKNTNLDDDLIYLKDNNIQGELCRRLNDTKGLIDEYPKEGERIKKKIHDYEYIYTSNYRNNISNITN